MAAVAGMTSITAQAQAPGSVIVAGSSWLGGKGVDVHWNNNDCCCGYGSSYTICPGTGSSVYTGCEWQCVELPQRLYTTLGWHCGSWPVSCASQLYGRSDVGTAHANGSGYIPVPGDLIVFSYSAGSTCGHVTVVDHVDATHVYCCDENDNSTGRLTLGLSGSTMANPSWGTIAGTMHNANNNLATTDGATFVSQTVANNTSFSPGQAFSCTFTMHNSGTSTWMANGASGYTLNNYNGAAMGAPFYTPCSANIAPGADGTFTINFTAPTAAGTYTANFQMNNVSSVYFGAQVAFTIQVAAPGPVINTQPATQTVAVGANPTFSVTASGSGLSYQWRKAGSNISGATASSYALSNVQVADGDFYSVVVSNNTGGNVTSTKAQLVITQTPYATGTGTGLQGDYYDNLDFTQYRLSKTNAQVNFDWGTGSPDPSIGNTTYSIRWTGAVQPLYTQTYTFYTTTDDGVRLWVNGTLLIDHWVDQGATEWSGSIALTAGTSNSIKMEYYQNVGSSSAALSWSAPSQLEQLIPATQLYLVAAPPSITTQPASQTASVGANVTFSVAASGSPLSYQWAFNGTNIAGATTSDYTRNNVQSADVGLYSVVVSNFVGVVTSADAALSLNDAVAFSDDFESGNLSNWAVNISPATALGISTAQNHTTGGAYSAHVATSSDRMYHNFGTKVDGHNKSTFWIYDSSQTRTYGDLRGYSGASYNNGSLNQLFAAGRYNLVTMPGEVYDGTKYQGRVLTGANAGWFNLNASGVPARSAGWHKFEIDHSTDGATVSFYVDGVLGRTITGVTASGIDSVTIGSTGSGSTAGESWLDDVRVEYFDPPTISSQPSVQNVSAGSGAAFTVGAGGTITGYQWRKNGVNLVNGGNVSGATSATLSLSNVQGGDAANYDVVVSNGAGPVVSSAAALLVAPAITTQPASRTNNAGTTATFNVAAAGQTPFTYQWKKGSSPLSDGGNISGSTTATLTLSGVSQSDAASYSVVVSNTAGNATSAAAILTVVDPPAITAQPQNQAVAAGASATFSVGASSTAPLTYQWKFNGTNISGATGSAYTRTNAQSADMGNYVAVVSNSAGSTNSAAAALTVNNPPVLAAIGNRTVHARSTVTITNTATDSDVPAQTLSFSLDPGAPAGAAVNSASGIFTWTTTDANASSTNAITTRVTDNGSPSQSDAKTFTITVIARPSIQSITASNNTVTITWSAIAGTTYRVQTKFDLSDANWVSITDVPATGPTASFADSMGNEFGPIPQKFYRILVLN